MEQLSGLSFLVVSGNRHMLSVVRVLLQAFAARQVHECDDSASALQALKSTAADIVIVDHQAEMLDGIQFARDMRSPASPDRYVPIVLLGPNKRTLLNEARNAGVTEVVIKPVTAKDLFSRIHAVIHYPRPFIDVRGYFGPCRRFSQEPGWRGPERRKPVALVQAPVHPAMEAVH